MGAKSLKLGNGRGKSIILVTPKQNDYSTPKYFKANVHLVYVFFSHPHQQLIPIHTTYLDQEKKLIDFIHEE